MTGEIANLASRDFDAPRSPPSWTRKRRTRIAISVPTARRRPVPTPSLLARASHAHRRDDGRRCRHTPVETATSGTACDDTGCRNHSAFADADAELIERAAAIYEGMRIGTAEMRGLSAETRKARSSSKRSGSTWKTARSVSLHSKGSIQARRKGPSSSDASRSSRWISPISCECRRSSPIRRSDSPERLRGYFPSSRVSRSRASRRRSRTPESSSTSTAST